MPVQIQLRRDTAANWTTTNPTLAAGELGLETDTAKYKIGNGSTAWSSLAYSSLPSNAIDANTINAKGDLLVGTADNTIGVLTAGTAGYVLMVDSSTATGVKWAAIPPSGGLATTTEGAIMTMDIGA
jgi:Major tropism determinant N-terminal domain